VALDQGSSDELAAGGAPTDGVLVRNGPSVYLLQVDDERLYWVGGSTITSCLKERCASSLVNYVTRDAVTESGEPVSLWFAPQGGEVVWATNTGIYSCPRSGCSGGPRRLGKQRLEAQYALDDTRIVALNEGDGIYTMPRSGGEWSRLVERSAQWVGGLGVHAGYVYWAETPDGTHDTEVLRLPELGGAEVQTVAHFPGAGSRTGVAFDSSFVYITDTRQAGAVFRCPLDGCVGEPESVFGPIREPSAIAVDDAGACVLYAHDTLSLAVGCATPSTSPLTELFSNAVDVVMDSDYVYGAHNHARPGGVPEVPDLYDISRWAR
jgi:hypothetical protein